ncbi:MAG: hypothetical protein ACK55Z_19350, partial [bacterium]
TDLISVIMPFIFLLSVNVSYFEILSIAFSGLSFLLLKNPSASYNALLALRSIVAELIFSEVLIS